MTVDSEAIKARMTYDPVLGLMLHGRQAPELAACLAEIERVRLLARVLLHDAQLWDHHEDCPRSGHEHCEWDDDDPPDSETSCVEGFLRETCDGFECSCQRGESEGAALAILAGAPSPTSEVQP